MADELRVELIRVELARVQEQMRSLQADAHARVRFLAKIEHSGEVPVWRD